MDRGRKANRLTYEEQNALQLIKTNNLDDLYFPCSLVVARMHWKSTYGRTLWKMELYKTSKFTIQISERTNEERWSHNSRGEMRNSWNRAFSRVSHCRKYCYNGNFSTFRCGENPLYDDYALLASLGRESSIRLNIMYYERKRHYNPILNVKVAAGSRGELRVT